MTPVAGWARRHPRWVVAGRVALAVVLLLLVSLEGVVLARQPTFPHAVAWAAGIVACLCAVPNGRVPLRIRASVAAGVSWGVSLLLIFGRQPLVVWGMGEAIALLVLLTGVLRTEPPRRAAVLGPLLALGCVAAPARDVHPGQVPLLFAVLAGVVAVYSLLLRAQAEQRVRDLAAVRSFERRELARELHDVVAHHVTGIAVQVRAARFASLEAEAAGRAFERIESEADEALNAMRRLVTLMRRSGGSENPETAPVAGLGEVRGLAESFSRTGPAVVLDVDEEVERGISPDVAASVHRIVRESLTNVRKHAVGASAVHVRIRTVGDGVELRVTDDGGGRDGARAREPARGRHGAGGEGERAGGEGGFGIVGMSERAAAMGGTLRAGPAPEGGWQVVAVLPRTRADEADVAAGGDEGDDG